MIDFSELALKWDNHILGFVSLKVAIMTMLLCQWSAKAARGNIHK